MHALDNFISPIPSFDGDVPILAITVSARPPGDESVSDPSTGASATKTQLANREQLPTRLLRKSLENHGEIFKRD
jgi:hypothetical protein